MPIRKKLSFFPHGEMAVWIVDENVQQLRNLLDLSAEENLQLDGMSLRRQREWLAARNLIHQLSGRRERASCAKDAYGKPYLPDSPFEISISHSQNRVAVIASPYMIGVDIQEIVDKMERISTKFVNEKEWGFVPSADHRLEILHIIWGAKEAMYKAWGRKGIDFKAHMLVHKFQWNGRSSQLSGMLRKDNIQMNFNVNAEKLDDYILVYAIEKDRYIYAD